MTRIAILSWYASDNSHRLTACAAGDPVPPGAQVWRIYEGRESAGVLKRRALVWALEERERLRREMDATVREAMA